VNAFTWFTTRDKVGKEVVVRFPKDTVVGMWKMNRREVETFVDGLFKQLADQGEDNPKAEVTVQLRLPVHAIQFAAVNVQKKLRLVVRPDELDRG